MRAFEIPIFKFAKQGLGGGQTGTRLTGVFSARGRHKHLN